VSLAEGSNVTWRKKQFWIQLQSQGTRLAEFRGKERDERTDFVEILLQRSWAREPCVEEERDGRETATAQAVAHYK
jgi:hypothetical protein